MEGASSSQAHESRLSEKFQNISVSDVDSNKSKNNIETKPGSSGNSKGLESNKNGTEVLVKGVSEGRGSRGRGQPRGGNKDNYRMREHPRRGYQGRRGNTSTSGIYRGESSKTNDTNDVKEKGIESQGSSTNEGSRGNKSSRKQSRGLGQQGRGTNPGKNTRNDRDGEATGSEEFSGKEKLRDSKPRKSDKGLANTGEVRGSRGNRRNLSRGNSRPPSGRGRQGSSCTNEENVRELEGARESGDVRNMEISEKNLDRRGRNNRGRRGQYEPRGRQRNEYQGFDNEFQPRARSSLYNHVQSQDPRYQMLNPGVAPLMSMPLEGHLGYNGAQHYGVGGNVFNEYERRNQEGYVNSIGMSVQQNGMNFHDNMNYGNAYNNSGYSYGTQYDSERVSAPMTTGWNADPRAYYESHQDVSLYREAASARDNPRRSYGDKRFEKSSSKKKEIVKKFDDSQHSVQASVLAEQLYNGTYECMVCYETLRCADSVWNCTNCFHIFHLNCIRKWARSAKAVVEGDGIENGWRCPACQNVVPQVPNTYRCFCGKVKNPAWNPRQGLTPHSCGELCKKKKEQGTCTHHCNQLCHPGPCPNCPVMVKRTCPCGKTQMQMRCGNPSKVICALVCDKLLNCGKHRCQQNCHEDSCSPCDVKVEQNCYCSKKHREVLCGTDLQIVSSHSGGYYTCNEICERPLDCQNHNCKQICHSKKCKPCQLQPALVTHCPCWKVPLVKLVKEKPRMSCLDPIPTCQNQCGKILPCGKMQLQGISGSVKNLTQHVCKLLCHTGECGSCEGMSVIQCRCKASTKEILCKEIIESGLKEYLCDQRCNKKKNCGRHKCKQNCCVDTEHNCDLICGKKLRCGGHKCDEPCHPRSCPPCWQAGFEELSCNCGSTILYPPIPCGTKPPDCDQLCSRMHPCSHPVTHICHSDDACPPCVVLTKKWCMGSHEIRHNIPCFMVDVSCGHPCGKPLPCQQHNCLKICHKGECCEENYICTQPCQVLRKECGHSCGAPCHAGKACPLIPCKVKIPVKCKCGHRVETTYCISGGDKTAMAQVYQRFTTETLATKMRDMQSGHSVDITGIVKLDDPKNRQLECNEECAVLERNRRVAEALQIDNSNIRSPQQINYTLFLQDEAKRNPQFVMSSEQALENLVVVTMKLQSDRRSHSFPPMNSIQRRIIHELAPYYGCTTASYDQEPMRNTVVTALKTSRLPPQSLSSQISRELYPPPPPPVPYLPSDKAMKGIKKKEDSSENSKPKLDYFADDLMD